jgi:Tol biopolymer transport system component
VLILRLKIMRVESGTRLGPYEILAPLGAGGMGEVYRARDTRLERQVAIKVLPAELAASADFRQRFEREAKTISSLNHPHICALFDVGHQDGVDFLVMELLEGETLAERLKRGSVAADQIQRIGIQIAEALDRAHRQGLVHRDLKPGNVMLTPAGAKLMDFGLAKSGAASHDGSSLTAMPTQNTPLTAEGTLVGTFQYMSPEQIEGKEADARSDIFALGAVLYEMATGKRAFEGKSQISVMAAILEKDPPSMSDLQPMTPPALERLVRTCLAKDPEQRLQSARDVKLQLEWIGEAGSRAGAPAVVVRHRKNREKLAWAVSGVFAIAAAALGVGFVLRAPKPESPVRFQFVLPEGMSVVQAPRISPDGQDLAFSATGADGKSQIWIRSLSALDPRPVSGTEGATFRPFWAPDSRHIAFIAGGKLKRVDISGAPPQTLCDAPTGADGSWGKDGVILFDGQTGDPIRRVPASGGIPQDVVKGEDGGSVGWPYFLPDGRHFLYFEFGGGRGGGRIMVAGLDPKDKPKPLVAADSLAEYARPGHLLYVKEGTLVAQPFDPSTLAVAGEPVPVAEQIGTTANGLADFSVSDDGVLVYRSGGSSDSRLVWVDRSGKEVADVSEPAEYGSTSLSPDDTRLAVSIRDPRSDKSDLWVRDLKRGVTSRLTFDAGNDGDPVWSPDGTRIVFSSEPKGSSGLYVKDASGTGPASELWSCGDKVVPNDWSRDGRYLAVNRLTAKTSWDIWVFPMDRKAQPFAFVAGPFVEVLPVFSPDGRYVAYMSNETGRFEIYIRQFPGPGGKWQVSANGGTEPHWSSDGKTVYFHSLDAKVMAVPVETGASFSAGVPQVLFAAQILPGQRRNGFLVTRDGQRFLLLAPIGKQGIAPMVVVLHWPAALKD